MLYGMMQFIFYKIARPKKLRQFYNLGLATVVLGYIPLAIYYIYYIQFNGLVTGIVYIALFTFIIVNKMNYSWLSDKKSPYLFAEEELRRFNIPEKLQRVNK